MRPAMEIDGSVVPPGFRFHPTEEELVGYYLKRKINSQKIDLDVIIDIDLYRMEPWDIQDRCNLGYEEQNEWYFFSHKDKKYPTGTRTNRATAAGFWKATGRDKAVLFNNKVIGMRKTLVFYKGRAPNGKKSDWIMHEYRLQTSEYAPPQEEGWVVCRAFKKPSPSHRQGYEAWNHNYYMRTHPSSHNNNMIASQVPPTGVTSPIITQGTVVANACNHQAISLQQQQLQQQHHHQYGGFDQEFIMPPTNNNVTLIDSCNQLIDLPQLDSPSLSTSLPTRDGFSNNNNNNNNNNGFNISEEYHEEKSSNHDHSNWKFLDNLLNSQMPHETMSSSSSSFPRPSSQMVAHGQDNYDHNQMGHFLDCFPNL